jgi:hypothetical protein
MKMRQEHQTSETWQAFPFPEKTHWKSEFINFET